MSAREDIEAAFRRHIAIPHGVAPSLKMMSEVLATTAKRLPPNTSTAKAELVRLAGLAGKIEAHIAKLDQSSINALARQGIQARALDQFIKYVALRTQAAAAMCVSPQERMAAAVARIIIGDVSALTDSDNKDIDVLVPLTRDVFSVLGISAPPGPAVAAALS